MEKSIKNLSTFASLGLVIIVDSIVGGMVFPLMGLLFTDPHHAIVPLTMSLHWRDLYYGLAMGIFFFFSILGSPLLGDLSDIFGRRKSLMVSLVLVSISCLLGAVAVSMKSIWLFIFSRGIGGLAAGNQGLAQAAIIDISEPETKARNISLITLVACVGFVLGPMAGGFFADKQIFSTANFSTPFLVAALLALTNVCALFFSFRETFHPSKSQPLQLSRGLKILYQGFLQKKLQKWLWVFLLMQLAWGLYFQWVSLLLSQVEHYSPNQIGLFMSAIGLVFVIGLGTLVPFCLKRYSLHHFLIGGIGLEIIGVLINGFWVTSVLAHWVSMVFFALGEAVGYTCLTTLISNAVEKEQQGLAMGTAVAVGSFAWGVSAFGVGLLGSFQISAPFFTASLLLIGTLFMRIHRQEKT